MTNNSPKLLEGFQPTVKTLVVSFLAGAVLTLGVGFMLLDWRTAGSAEAMTRNAVTSAEAELASNICVERFIGAPDAEVNLRQLKAAKSWDRGALIEKGGWVQFSMMTQGVPGAASLCANKLAEIESIAAVTSPGSTG